MKEESWLTLLALGNILAWGGIMFWGVILRTGDEIVVAAPIVASIFLIAVVNGWKGRISSWWWRFRHTEEQDPRGFC